MNNYIVYNRSDISSHNAFNCLVQDEEQVANHLENTSSNRVSDGLFRVYRLAMACTIEYAAFHVNAA